VANMLKHFKPTAIPCVGSKIYVVPEPGYGWWHERDSNIGPGVPVEGAPLPFAMELTNVYPNVTEAQVCLGKVITKFHLLHGWWVAFYIVADYEADLGTACTCICAISQAEPVFAGANVDPRKIVNYPKPFFSGAGSVCKTLEPVREALIAMTVWGLG
jgi:hypothetical protein